MEHVRSDLLRSDGPAQNTNWGLLPSDGRPLPVRCFTVAWRARAAAVKMATGRKKTRVPAGTRPVGADTGVNLCPRARVRVQSCANGQRLMGKKVACPHPLTRQTALTCGATAQEVYILPILGFLHPSPTRTLPPPAAAVTHSTPRPRLPNSRSRPWPSTPSFSFLSYTLQLCSPFFSFPPLV